MDDPERAPHSWALVFSSSSSERIVKQDGQWLPASARETIAMPPSNYEHLEALEWLAGDWEDEAEKGPSAKFSYSWTENKNFLVAAFMIALLTTLVIVATFGFSSLQWALHVV
jgi:hypothetical protein